MKNSFTTICLLRNIFLATMCTWRSVNVERWPLWDMTILRHDIFPTATIMRHDIFPTTTIMKDDHLETWFFCYYIHNLIWEKNLSTSDAPNNQPSLGGLTCLLLWPFWDLVKKDILRRNHFEIWTICNNNLFETWHFWDMICLRQ